jgi:hypothetical protein
LASIKSLVTTIGSFTAFTNPQRAKIATRELFRKAIITWEFTPVRFQESRHTVDFEIYMNRHDLCSGGGCVLASAFFPDGGKHRLELYPQLFNYNEKEKVNTLIHEIGHIYGLRHFFAKVSEEAWASKIYGEHKPFSIMNYGHKSRLTESDISDLKKLYKAVWRKDITNIGGTPIVLMTPYHYYSILVL